ncbi:hypothetical protein RRG08_008382 [Elysia crispata]|uniref:Uncharacterized protein n=1 Tax=Elysia crispata TaxID=231223 RepID=A0AAE1AYW7_9GAST|nr:hypothetical protein RRG08_008382 [Elysia crispata]
MDEKASNRRDYKLKTMEVIGCKKGKFLHRRARLPTPTTSDTQHRGLASLSRSESPALVEKQRPVTDCGGHEISTKD